jgi:hypothetical protein
VWATTSARASAAWPRRPPDHRRLTLDQLAAVYSRDGAFYATRPVRAADGSWTTAKPDPQRPGFQAEDSGNA